MSSRYSIGIDLGTTNTVLAYVLLEAKQASPRILPIPQVTGPHQHEAFPSLPSFLYIPSDREKAEGALSQFGEWCVGSYAKSVSAEQPERTIAAAKSWLCQASVDRQAAILPWQAPDEVDKLSPVAVSACYLKHVVQAWNTTFPDFPFHQQQVTLTVPASFDMVARELTVEAARQADFPADFILLEEPQAAIYHWIQAVGDDWRSMMEPGQRILVCDCGGGTTDLTMLVVDQQQGELSLRRMAVGNHLLVGGDNMDVTMAHWAAEKFAAQGVKLNAWQAVSLWHACRTAKERLLSQENITAYPVSVLGRGSRLIGGTVSVDLPRDELETLLVDGFFPRCQASDRPQTPEEIGLQEIGLSYEHDTGITRHIAAFLQDHDSLATSEDGSNFPSRLLFNGGVFKSRRLKERLMEVLLSWKPETAEFRELGGEDDLDIAVASGAAYYGWAKLHGGVRIRGGTPCSFYVGVESTGPAIPGMPRPLHALCVAPQGMEEGTEADLPGRQFGLVVGKPAKFRFFSSHQRPQDTIGTWLRFWDEGELIESNALEVTLPPAESPVAGELMVEPGAVERPRPLMPIPVRFHTKITELGMFELWCVSVQDQQRWKLSFNIRPQANQV